MCVYNLTYLTYLTYLLNLRRVFVKRIVYNIFLLLVQRHAKEHCSHCTRIYPIVLMLSLFALWLSKFPHVFRLSSKFPPLPNPNLELHSWQSFWSLPRIPILALERPLKVHLALNPSFLQFSCNEASEPAISDIHLSRPSEVLRYFPSAIREYKELAVMLMTINSICWPIFIPRQISEKDVFQ